MNKVIAFSAALAVAVVVGVWMWATHQVVQTTVCDLARNPERFAGRIVKVRGRIDSDGFEWLQLKDDHCKMSGINMEYSDVTENSMNVRKVDDAIRTAPWGTDYKDIRATVVGKFVWNPSTKDAHARVQLWVDKMESVEVKRLKEKRVNPFPELR